LGDGVGFSTGVGRKGRGPVDLDWGRRAVPLG